MGKKAKVTCAVCGVCFKLRSGRRTCPGCEAVVPAVDAGRDGGGGGPPGLGDRPPTPVTAGRKRRRDGDSLESSLELSLECDARLQSGGTAGPSTAVSVKRRPLGAAALAAEQAVPGGSSAPGARAAAAAAAPLPASKKAGKRAKGNADVARVFSFADRRTLVDTADALLPAMQAISRCSELAVDCEGVRLSRKGALTLIQVATQQQVYLFDVAVLGARVFDGASPLRRVLEDKHVVKLMFDCRRDSDALFHQFGVRLAGVIDVQLEVVAARRAHGGTSPRLPGLASAARQYISSGLGAEAFKIKERMRARFGGEAEADLWARRPMDSDTLRYAALDVALLVSLHRRLTALPALSDPAADWARRVAGASAARAAEWRDAVVEIVQTQNAAHMVPPAF